jgi:hypothetical protein
MSCQVLRAAANHAKKEDSLDTLKSKVKEFAAIAADLPENLQVVCFEMLLKSYLGALAPPTPTLGAPATPKLDNDVTDAKSVEQSSMAQDDLTLKDLHTKVRRFIEKYSISIDHLNNLFYKEDGNILPLYEDLKTTRMSESQIRIALLQSLHSALTTGEFTASVEEVRQGCTDRKCYDTNNFAAHFRNNKSLFDFDNYTKNTKAVKLSEEGRKELAQVIKDLQ